MDFYDLPCKKMTHVAVISFFWRKSTYNRHGCTMYKKRTLKYISFVWKSMYIESDQTPLHVWEYTRVDGSGWRGGWKKQRSNSNNKKKKEAIWQKNT